MVRRCGCCRLSGLWCRGCCCCRCCCCCGRCCCYEHSQCCGGIETFVVEAVVTAVVVVVVAALDLFLLPHLPVHRHLPSRDTATARIAAAADAAPPAKAPQAPSLLCRRSSRSEPSTRPHKRSLGTSRRRSARLPQGQQAKGTRRYPPKLQTEASRRIRCCCSFCQGYSRLRRRRVLHGKGSCVEVVVVVAAGEEGSCFCRQSCWELESTTLIAHDGERRTSGVRIYDW